MGSRTKRVAEDRVAPRRQRLPGRRADFLIPGLAVGETFILLHPILPL